MKKIKYLVCKDIKPGMAFTKPMNTEIHKHVVMVPIEDYNRLIERELPTTALVEKMCLKFLSIIAYHMENHLKESSVPVGDLGKFFMDPKTSNAIVNEWRKESGI